MAFEYLMACYLLTGQVDKIAANMEHLKEFDYDGIPTLYEEAMLIYIGSQGRKIDLSKSNIRRETFDRYVRFVQLKNSMRLENRQVVLTRLISEFGSSYFFYFTFGRVGVL
jgi:SpoVK/Ycf46/Vps4 family AAA+-type ATPase